MSSLAYSNGLFKNMNDSKYDTVEPSNIPLFCNTYPQPENLNVFN